jgi:aspartyl protease family protein
MNEANRSLALVAATFLALLGVMAWGLGLLVDQRNHPNSDVEAAVTGPNEVVLQANPIGQYLVPGEINGERVTFLVDTGATHVAVPAGVAERIGLERGADIAVETAGGRTQAWSTVLDRIVIGGIVQRDVRGTINPAMEGDEVLLGMTFLRGIELRQQNERLILRAAEG